MFDCAVLEIQLAPSHGRPVAGMRLCNTFRGGPAILLHWLETQLGLLRQPPAQPDCIMNYAKALDSCTRAVFTRSYEIDPWGTARELLARRSELRLAGWNEKGSRALPELVRDLARVAKKQTFLPDERDRLDLIMAALAKGQVLPAHKVMLWDPLERWPAAWRPVLMKLTLVKPPAVTPLAQNKTALRFVQEQVLRGKGKSVQPDASLRQVRARSVQSACEAVAKTLAPDPGSLPGTVVLCESNSVALCLDACLAQTGLPTMGAYGITLSHPALQVLPLALRLCWEPVEPQLLMDFLALPVSPLPKQAARALAQALSNQPGLGSRQWEKTRAELTRPQNDSNGRIAERMGLWLEMPRVPLGEPLPIAMVDRVCQQTATWASAYAQYSESNKDTRPELTQALRLLASQAAVLRQLVQEQGQDVTEPQLTRLLESSQSQGLPVRPHLQAHGGPVLVSTLAEIQWPVKRLVWLGLSTEDPRACRWTVRDLEELTASGVDLDDGTRALTSLRESERRGLCRIQEAMLAIELPGDKENRPHPVWLQIAQVLRQPRGTQVPALADIFVGSATKSLSSWTLPTATIAVIAPQPARPLWTIPQALLHQRKQSSASSLQARLGCPLKWVLNYQAYLRASPLACLPDDFQLKGLFCHACLEDVFGQGRRLPTPDKAAQMIGKVFDERLALDAAPLAAPHRAGEINEVREQLVNAAHTLAATLRAGGYQVQGMEVSTLDSKMDGRALNSFIDCLAVRKDGQEAVIDFKYAGYTTNRDKLKEGRAVQLALYAYARSQQANGKFPAVGYLVLDRGVFYTPAGSRILGNGPLTVVDGPAISTVWDTFSKAVQEADTWFSGTSPIPARPLQSPEDYPEGCGLVIEQPGYNQSAADKYPCRYCDYKVLCGMEELS